MTKSMVGVLLRFRHGEVGLAPDVKVIFHQVRVWKQDQDALAVRYLVAEVHIYIYATSSPCVVNSVLR